MKKALLFLFPALIGTISVLFILFAYGAFDIAVSAYSHYRLNEEESKLIDNAIARFRENVENENYEEITRQLRKGGRDKDVEDRIIENIKDFRDKYGKASSKEFFRATVPEDSSRFYKSTTGTVYGVFYFTKAENGEFDEYFDLNISDDKKVTLLEYRASEIQDWATKARKREKYIDNTYPNEVRIPFGARFIEIRY